MTSSGIDKSSCERGMCFGRVLAVLVVEICKCSCVVMRSLPHEPMCYVSAAATPTPMLVMLAAVLLTMHIPDSAARQQAW